MGIVPVLRNLLYPPRAGECTSKPPRIEIYGPAGIRTFVRSILQMTFTKTSDRYVVHELLKPNDTVTPCGEDDVHPSEAPGKDIFCSPDDGFWREFTSSSNVFVDAGPILHREPCIGYVIREAVEPNRKIVVLGDTNDPSAILPLCDSPSLLIHEATDTHIPSDVSASLSKLPPETVLEKTLAKGHSTPTMAGEFAKQTGAQRLVLNHIGGRFPAPRHNRDTQRASVIEEIERQATEAWDTSGCLAKAAWDYMRVVVPANNALVQMTAGLDGNNLGQSRGEASSSSNRPPRGHYGGGRGGRAGFNTRSRSDGGKRHDDSDRCHDSAPSTKRRRER